MYASLTDLTGRQPTFSGSSYSDLVLVNKLEAAARILDGYLAQHYSLPVGVAASAALTFTGNVSEDDTVTVGSKTYTFKASPSAANEVDVGATSTASAINLLRAINQGAGSGTSYDDATTVNTEAKASRSALVLTVTARKDGPEGNDIALSTTASNITASAAYLSGGLREYEVLVELNVWLATTFLLFGQVTSSMSGGGNQPLTRDIKEALKDAIANIGQSGGLVDTTGTTLTPPDQTMLTDGDDGYPFADVSDPTNWGYWDEMEFDRE